MSWFRNILDKIADKLGYISKSEMYSISDSFKVKLMKLTTDNINLQSRYDQLMTDYNTSEASTKLELQKANQELQSKIDKIMADCKTAEDYYKSVQKQISEALTEDSRFKFGFRGGIIGSSHVGSAKDTNSGNILINGRTVFLDEVTEKIQRASSMNEKYYIALNQLIKYGLIEKVSERLIQSGALEFTLGYNQDCTSLELFYQITCVPPEAMLTVDYNDK